MAGKKTISSLREINLEVGMPHVDQAIRRAFVRCDTLRRDADLDRYNNGVTFIVL